MAVTSKLSRLTLRSCRSIVGPVSVDLPESGLVLVRGKNLETGGSSGSGKTSLLVGLAYALGYSPFPATTLQTWDAEPLQVELSFSTPEGPAVLARGAKTSLRVGETLTKGSVAAVEARLKQLLGLSPSLLEALTYRGQKTQSKFLSMKDDAKKEFLVEAIPELAPIEAKAGESEAKAKALADALKLEEASLRAKEQHLAELKAGSGPPTLQLIQPLQAAVEDHEAKVAAARKALADSLKAEADDVARITATVAALMDEYRPRLDASDPEGKILALPPPDKAELNKLIGNKKECEFRIKKVKETDQARRFERQMKVDTLRMDIQRCESMLETKPQVEADLASARDALRKLGEHECPTCHQHWVDNLVVVKELYSKVEKLESKLRLIGLAWNECTDKSYELRTMEPLLPLPNIARLEAALQVIIVKIAEEQARLNEAERVAVLEAEAEYMRVDAELNARVKEAEASKNRALEAAVREQRGALEQLEKAKMPLVTALVTARAQNDAAQDAYGQVLVAIKKNEERVEQARAKYEAASLAYKTEADLAQMLGNNGFLGAIFDEILVEIAAETNAILAAVPNTSHISLRFRSEQITQKGTSKRAIVTVLTVRDREVTLAAGISGGQGTAVELAVDLAVTRVVSRRTGVMPGWLILDEVFTGLGIVEKEVCMEILAKYAEDRLVLIVDHDSVFKEMFTKTIDLVFENGVTSICAA